MSTRKKAAVRLAILVVVAGGIVIAFLLASRNIDVLSYLKKLHGG